MAGSSSRPTSEEAPPETADDADPEVGAADVVPGMGAAFALTPPSCFFHSCGFGVEGVEGVEVEVAAAPFFFHSCGFGVTVPTSVNPNPIFKIGAMTSAFLSNPADKPTGLGKRSVCFV